MLDPAAPGFVAHDVHVMGTDARLLARLSADEAHPVLERAEQELQRLDALLTRFNPASELEQLNDAGHGTVGSELRELLELACTYHAATSGRFDVGVGQALLNAGYDRTYRSLDLPNAAERERFGSAMLEAMHDDDAAFTARALRFVLDDDYVRIDDGARIDLGGIAKGWAADRIASQISREGGGCSSLVSLGGDIAVRVRDGDAAWPVRTHAGSEGSLTLSLAYGGMATSGWEGRSWRTGDAEQIAHHVIDPRTGRPALTDVSRITVIGPSCTDAEVWATALMLVGSKRAITEAAERGLTILVVDAHGACTGTGALASR